MGKATCNSKADKYEDSTHSEDEHKEEYEKSTEANKFLIIDCSVIIYVDVMGVKCLEEVYTSMLQKGVRVMFASAKAPLLELFEISGHYKSVSKAHFYPTLHDAMFFARHERGMVGLRRVSSIEDLHSIAKLEGHDQNADIRGKKNLTNFSVYIDTDIH